MSLFICKECGAVENTACVNLSRVNNTYPNMTLSDMTGYGSRTITLRNGDVKEPDEVMMLCSECNTSVRVGDKVSATEDEHKLAAHSKFSMITPFDHADGSIQVDRDAPHGFSSVPEDVMRKNMLQPDDLLRIELAGIKREIKELKRKHNLTADESARLNELYFLQNDRKGKL